MKTLTANQKQIAQMAFNARSSVTTTERMYAAVEAVLSTLPTEELAEALQACADELDTYEWGDHENTHNIQIRARAVLRKAGLE